MSLVSLIQRLRYPQWEKMLSLYRAAETMPQEQIEAFQLSRLREVVEHFYRTLPAYRALCQEKGVSPEQLESVSDLARLPVVDKAFIRENETALRERSPRAHRRSTSGSTGVNFHFLLDRSAKCAHSTFAAYYRARLGIGRGLTVGIWGGNLKKPEDNSFLDRVKNRLQNIILLPGYGMDEARALEYLAFLREHRPTFVYAYPSYLAFLARVGKACGAESPSGFVLVASGEQMTSQDRAAIEEYFKMRVYNRYGSCEFSTIAHELDGVDGFYVNPMQFLLQTNEQGELLVTDLWNLATPFIRYNIGDRAELFCAEGKCCITELLGRCNDVIYTPSGKMIPSQFFTILSRMCEQVETFQVVQTSETELKMRVRSKEAFDPAAILSGFEKNFGDEMTLCVVRDEPFETTAMGKHKFIIRKEAQ